MSIPPRTALTTLAVAVASQACSGSAGVTDTRAQVLPVPELAASGTPERSPAALEKALTRWERAHGAERERLAEQVDHIAGQRYATISRLYWYTDLDAAEAAAKETGKPILSLRMLGRLDEDRSCANSRFFRVVLYGNAELSTWLKDHFVLHWSSERPVPKLTIDYGDGRKVETTIAGNSAHYVLDADGRVLDVIPGLMTPKAFRDELEGSLALADATAHGDYAKTLAKHHAAQVDAIDHEWKAIGAGEIPATTWQISLAQAERRAMSKARVELPVVKTAVLGPDPRLMPADDPAWEQIGVRILSARGLEAAAPQEERPFETDARVKSPPPVLDPQSRALLAAIAPSDWARPGEALESRELDATIARFEASVVADTAINLTQLRRAIHAELAGRAEVGAPIDFGSINQWLYASVFLTPAADLWLGMATPGVFTGLPRDGVVVEN
jgi:hypothetical protein